MGPERSGTLGGLCKEVRDVVSGANERHTDLEILDHVAYEVVTTGHMLHAIMIDRIVGSVARTLVVGVEVGGAVDVRRVEAGQEPTQIDNVLVVASESAMISASHEERATLC